MTKNKSGFTIVELLIVIVVIGILAGISIVSYSGAQQRARNTQMIAAAKEYSDALILYSLENDSYPTFSEYAVCLGESYPSGQCWSGPNGDFYVKQSFDTALQNQMPTKPEVPVKSYAITAQDNRSGMVYYRNVPVGGKSIEYALEGGNQSCSLSGAVADNVANGTTTRCRLTLPAI